MITGYMSPKEKMSMKTAANRGSNAMRRRSITLSTLALLEAQPERQPRGDQGGQHQQQEHAPEAGKVEDDPADGGADGGAQEARGIEHAGAASRLRQRQCREAHARRRGEGQR